MKNIKLVDCEKQYWDFVRELRMDDRVCGGFIENIKITPKMQESYMNKYADCYRIGLMNKKPVGFVGVIDDDIRVCTHPDFQGQGIGKFMVNECMKIWPTSFAKIKIENEVSMRLFKSCGFKEKYFILIKEQ